MASIRRATTPTVALVLHADITGDEWRTVVLTVECGGDMTDYTRDELELLPLEQDDRSTDTIIRLKLTQQETLDMHGRARFQIRAVRDDGLAIASCIRGARISGVLNQEVLA